jgi:hypothetical protein
MPDTTGKSTMFKIATPSSYAVKPIELPKVEYLKPQPKSKPSKSFDTFKGDSGSGQTLMMEPLKTKTIQTLDLRPEVDLRSLDFEPKTRTKTIFKEVKTLELKTESEVKGRKVLELKTENELKLDQKQGIKTIVLPTTYTLPKVKTVRQLRVQDQLITKSATKQRQETIFKPITELKVETNQRQETIFKPITVTKTTQRKETLFQPITEVVTKTKQRQETLFQPISATKTAQKQETLFKPFTETVTKTTPKQITEVTPIVEPVVTPKTGGALFPLIPFGSASFGGGSSPFGFKGKTRFTETYKVGEGTSMFSKSKSKKSKIF